MIENFQDKVAAAYDWIVKRVQEPSTRIAIVSAATAAAVVPAPWCYIVFGTSALTAFWPDKAA